MFSFKADSNGVDGLIQINGNTVLTISSSGAITAASSPATLDRSGKLVTTQKFADEFPLLNTASGWQKLPSGLIIQWGIASYTGSGARTVTYTLPIAFPTAHLWCGAVDSGGACFSFGSNPNGLTQATIYIPAAYIGESTTPAVSQTAAPRILAIGY
jgi:hypothetical protein